MTSEFNNEINNFKKIEIIEKTLDTVLVSNKLTVLTLFVPRSFQI